MWDLLLNKVLKEWGVIKRAPLAFAASVFLVSTLIVFGLEYFHSEKTSAHEATIKLQEEENIALLKKIDKQKKEIRLAWAAASGRVDYDDTVMVLTFERNGKNPIASSESNIHNWFLYEDSEGATLLIAFNVPVHDNFTDAIITGRNSIQVPKYKILEISRQYVVIRVTGKFSEGEYLIKIIKRS